MRGDHFIGVWAFAALEYPIWQAMSVWQQQAYMTRTANARASNQTIADKADRCHFFSRLPVLCECADPACGTIVLIALADYRAAYRARRLVTARGHAVKDGDPVALHADYWLHELRRRSGSEQQPWPGLFDTGAFRA